MHCWAQVSLAHCMTPKRTREAGTWTSCDWMSCERDVLWGGRVVKVTCCKRDLLWDGQVVRGACREGSCCEGDMLWGGCVVRGTCCEGDVLCGDVLWGGRVVRRTCCEWDVLCEGLYVSGTCCEGNVSLGGRCVMLLAGRASSDRQCDTWRLVGCMGRT